MEPRTFVCRQRSYHDNFQIKLTRRHGVNRRKQVCVSSFACKLDRLITPCPVPHLGIGEGYHMAIPFEGETVDNKCVFLFVSPLIQTGPTRYFIFVHGIIGSIQ